MKPAVRQTRPTQHHSCPRRRPTGDTLSCLSAGEPPEHQFPQHLTSTVSFNLVLASIFLYWLKQFTFVMCVSLLLITIKIDCHTCFIWLHLFFCTFSLCSFKSNLTPSRKLRFTVVESLWFQDSLNTFQVHFCITTVRSAKTSFSAGVKLLFKCILPCCYHCQSTVVMFLVSCWSHALSHWYFV